MGFVRVRAEARWLWEEWMRVQIVGGEWVMFVTAWWLWEEYEKAPVLHVGRRASMGFRVSMGLHLPAEFPAPWALQVWANLKGVER